MTRNNRNNRTLSKTVKNYKSKPLRNWGLLLVRVDSISQRQSAINEATIT